MVLKEVYDPNIFTYITAIVIGNPLIQVVIVSFMTIYM